MINVFAALQVLVEIDSKVALVDVVKDVTVVYPLYSAGTVPSPKAMIVNKTLQPTLAAVARLANLASTILLDPVEGPKLEALLVSVDAS